jgi:hypothetical protein
MIYVLVALHGMSVLEGNSPEKLGLWMLLSAIVLVGFRQREALLRAN